MRSHGDRDVDPAPEALQRGYDGFPLVEADDRAVGDIPFFNDWVNHSGRDQFWEEIDGHERAIKLNAPTLLMAGWYDPFLPTQLNDFIQIQREGKPEIAAASRLIIGPWSHAEAVKFPGGLTTRNYRLESLAQSIPWFDRHLRIFPPNNNDSAPVRIYVMGEHVWRDEQEWPLARTRYTPYYFHSGGKANSLTGDGKLSLTTPLSKEPFDTYTYDPLNLVPTAGGAMIGPRAGVALQNTVELRAES